MGDVESLYKDIGCFDMKYDEFKEMCRKACSEKLNCLCIDMTKNKKKGKNRFSNEKQPHKLNAFPKVKLFSLIYCFHLKLEMI